MKLDFDNVKKKDLITVKGFANLMKEKLNNPNIDSPHISYHLFHPKRDLLDYVETVEGLKFIVLNERANKFIETAVSYGKLSPSKRRIKLLEKENKKQKMK